MSLRIRRISSFSQLEELRNVWNKLSVTSPFGSWQWLHSWAEHYLSEDQLYTLVAETETGELAGILPLFRDTSSWQGRCLKLLGSGEVCSDYLHLFAEPNLQGSVCLEMAEWLADRTDDGECGWDSLLLDHISAADQSFVALAEALQQFGISVMEGPGMNCWRIALPDDWETYLKELSRSHRKQLRRLDRDYLRQGPARLVTVQTEEEFPAAMDTLVRLHQKRRNALGEAGCFASDTFREFMMTASRRLLAEGTLKLQVMEIDGEPIAAEYQVQQGQTTFAYQSGIDPDAMDCQPGNLIMTATIRQAIEAGHRGFDFLRGDEPYKPHFRAIAQPTIIRRFFVPTVRGKVTHAIRSLSRSTKNLVKPSTAV